MTMLLNIERNSFNDASLLVSSLSKEVRRLLIIVSPNEEDSHSKEVFMETVEDYTTKFQFPVSFEAGKEYNVEVYGLDNVSDIPRCHGNTSFRAVLTLSDIVDLHKKAVTCAGSSSAPVSWLYRNKPKKDFDDILLNKNGIMIPYIKDNSGDPGCPINGRINGLFFMASVKPGSREGEPEPRSSFGDTRLCVPVENLFLCASNLYFADFYCMKTKKKHYVTLVMTSPGSDADRFCQEYLLALPLDDPIKNPFLFKDQYDAWKVSAKGNLFIECMFTENVDIKGYSLTYNIKTRGKGKSTKGGRPKNPSCRKCNVTPLRGGLES